MTFRNLNFLFSYQKSRGGGLNGFGQGLGNLMADQRLGSSQAFLFS